MQNKERERKKKCFHEELLKIRWLGSDLEVNSIFKKTFLANLTDNLTSSYVALMYIYKSF